MSGCIKLLLLEIAILGCIGLACQSEEPKNQNGNSCNSLNCTGCCQDGQCVTSPTDQACGIGGAACQSCSESGLFCALPQGTCQAKGVCGPECKGCCQDGQCIDILNDSLCGKSGGSCNDCSSNGMVCDMLLGQCRPSAKANCTGCAGCCTSDGVCLETSAMTDMACGTGGDLCSDCSRSGHVCDLKTGMCEFASTDPLTTESCKEPEDVKCSASCTGTTSCTGAKGGSCTNVITLEGDSTSNDVLRTITRAYIDCWRSYPGKDKVCATFDTCEITGEITSNTVKYWICNVATYKELDSKKMDELDVARSLVHCSYYYGFIERPVWDTTLTPGGKGKVCLAYDHRGGWGKDRLKIGECSKMNF